MAKHDAARLLDELMGRYRNAAPDEAKQEVRWEDPEFCKFYMVKFCPHDLFVNTRADLGACAKVHDDEAKAQFEKSKNYLKGQYIDDFIKYANNLIHDVERKIVKGRQRLALIGQKAEAPSKLSDAQQSKNDDQITLLSEKINHLVSEAERVGMEGNVEQAQGLMKLCDQLKEERENLRKQNDNSAWSQTVEIAAAQEKQMEVCTTCGAFLIVGDAQARIDDHLMGKQHVGYSRLKAALDELTVLRHKEKEERRNKPGWRDGGGNGRRSNDKDDRSKRAQERSTSRVQESRDRSRERNNDRRERNRDYDERHRRSQHQIHHDRSNINRRSRSRDKDRSERGGYKHRSYHSSHRDPDHYNNRGHHNGRRY